jgi:4-hydroxy-2-oxoheptanedioate aldolase
MTIKSILEEGKTKFGFVGLKGELEAEGLSQIEVAREAIIAARNGLDYLIKIGGAEAKSNLQYLMDVGITSVVAPMIESPFAMEKYMEMLPEGAFDHVSVTIETVTAVENIEQILQAGTKLTEVTIGRTDLTASYHGTDVESERTINMVKRVARLAKARGLHVTMGGSISKRTVETLTKDLELAELVDLIETRKVVMDVEKFVIAGALEKSLEFELAVLEERLQSSEKAVESAKKRKVALSSRI